MSMQHFRAPLEEQEAYWKRMLGGELPVLQIWSDYPRPPVSSFIRATESLALESGLLNRIGNFSAEENLPPFVVLLAALNALLHRYTGQDDIIVGSPFAGGVRSSDGGDEHFTNVLPLRTNLADDPSFGALLKRVNGVIEEAGRNRDYALESMSEAPHLRSTSRKLPTFTVLFALREDAPNLSATPTTEDHLLEIEAHANKCDLFIWLYVDGDNLSLNCHFDAELFEAATIGRLLRHYQRLLEASLAHPELRLSKLPMLTEADRVQLVAGLNQTARDYPKDKRVHELVEAQAEKIPEATAVVFEDQRLTYRELNRRANQLAHYLRGLGVGPDVLVGICLERSLEMVVGLLGVLKAGGAYVPLDPGYPKERLAFMIEDSQAPVLLTQQRLVEVLPEHGARMICLDANWGAIAQESRDNPLSSVRAHNLAYVIYTSGSTGRPKGVMVSHRNVVNFFAGMDPCIEHKSAGVWLAVTSISFDISILELFWTLTRGFQVIVHGDTDLLSSAEPLNQAGEKEIEFSLFYFASNEGEPSASKYRLLMEGAKFADQHGFSAVWTPERHFHSFGGLYPNPSVTSAAVAAVTKSVKIRAGSVVLPLQSAIRVAEEWAVVDNLSNGRVGISFASGWHANDFVFAPENYAARREIMTREIGTVQNLWRGKSVSFKGGAGNDVEVKIFPRPIQRELPIWITAAGTVETFRMAGEMGANLLTHLLGQSLEDLAEKIGTYRKAWCEAGHSPGEGHVTLMLHTFVGDSIEAVREKVREPFLNYLKSSSDLVQKLAKSLGQNGVSDLTEADMKPHWDRAFNRYFETSGLFGTPDGCLQMIDRLKATGVDEVACLIDFGVDTDSVLSSLRYLNTVKERSNKRRSASNENFSLPAQIARHGVSHLQCTPSMARILTMDPKTLEVLRSLRELMLGGEALPISLAAELTEAVSGRIHNMYGPTETTIWSATYLVEKVERAVPIGRPILNTQIYILNSHLRPVPVGVVGEVFIGGAGVVRGYLSRPELTADRFIPDPFSQELGARLYRTGDLARYLPDGNIEFLGRLDHQVKIRGHRIELGEIETVLGQQPAVREAVVILREDVAGDTRLVAYLTARKQPFPSINELRKFLQQELPEHMVPSAFVLLDVLPLTPNGKVDRRALPVPDQARFRLEKPFVPPRKPLEDVLAGTWAKLLGVERVGMDDNFFELGGHSLFAVRLISQLRALFKVELPLSSLFDAPTVGTLAQAIIAHETRPGQSEKIAEMMKKVEGMSIDAVRRTLHEKKGVTVG